MSPLGSTLRILFVHSGSDMYGASRSLLRLSSRLVRDGVCVQAILPSEGPLVAALQEQGVSVVIQKTLAVVERQSFKTPNGIARLLSGSFRSTVGLLRLVRAFKPDIIHSMTAVILTGGLAAKIAGIPHVWHVRESFSEFGKLWRYYETYILWLSAKVICVSTPIAAQFNLPDDSEKIHVIHNGFPVQEFSGVSPDRVQRFREKYVSSEIDLLVGVVGRIKYLRKGQEVFVRAAARLQARFPRVRFLCIGSPFPGNEEHLVNLLSLIHELGVEKTVLYIGDADDVKAAIAGLDILVLSSVQPEPFAGVVVEAMALSRPVIATATGGSIEQVVDGQTGYLVTPGDPESMAIAIESLLAAPELRSTLGRNGRGRFLERFEFEAFYRRILDVYAIVTSAGHKSGT